MKKFVCAVPWLDGRPVISAVASTEREALVNVNHLNLTDEQLQRIEIREGELAVKDPVVAPHG